MTVDEALDALMSMSVIVDEKAARILGALDRSSEARGVAAERAAVVAWKRGRAPAPAAGITRHGEWMGEADAIERGDHHPEHRTALWDALDRARAEVLASCTEMLLTRAKLDREQARECFDRGEGSMGRFLHSRADDCDIFAGQMMDLPRTGDALRRLLAVRGREAAAEALRDVHDKAVALAARLVRLSDRTPNRGDPAYDDRPEVVDREAVVAIAMELKRLGEAAVIRGKAGTDG